MVTCGACTGPDRRAGWHREFDSSALDREVLVRDRDLFADPLAAGTVEGDRRLRDVVCRGFPAHRHALSGVQDAVGGRHECQTAGREGIKDLERDVRAAFVNPDRCGAGRTGPNGYRATRLDPLRGASRPFVAASENLVDGRSWERELEEAVAVVLEIATRVDAWRGPALRRSSRPRARRRRAWPERVLRRCAPPNQVPRAARAGRLRDRSAPAPRGAESAPQPGRER